ncbi:MAG: transaldolase [Pontimonas sp.]|nr:transaldolase [Pontimonas sp.]
MTLSPSACLSEVGVSIWLDDLSKDRLTSGSLKNLMQNHHVVGVTSNPTIFAGAVSGSDSYATDLARMARAGASPEEAVFEVMIADIQGACDVLRPVFDSTSGQDGRVSLEVSPLLAHDTSGTIAQAKELWARVDRPNLMIKIPATKAGLPAITEVIGTGISVNVTLIFSLERYAEVIEAYFAGIEKALSSGIDISTIRSVASFFVSRVDSAVDALLDADGGEAAAAVRSQAAVANARLAYELFRVEHSSDRVHALIAKGMRRQRPLWASTGVKDPALPPAYYVTELAVFDVVNTMPEKTLLALESEGVVEGDRVTGHSDAARETMSVLQELGISLSDITDHLEADGVEKFVQSWRELLDTVASAMGKSQ